jgi:UDP:flavonoid glycosyltransferase YjiC (YdhE family)
MLASGTQGDVQPFLALALGLRRAGIESVIAAAPRYRSIVESREVGFAPLEGNPSDLMAASGSMAATLSSGALKGIASTARFLRAAQSEYRRMLESAASACKGARTILAGLSSTWGISIAEALGIPCVLCMLQPFGRTRAFPSALLPVRTSLGDRYNMLSYHVMEQAMWLPWRRVTNAWRRRTLGLPSLPGAGPWRMMYASGLPCLYGFSPAVLPAPADWPPGHVVTGYWFLEEEPGWRPRPALEQFLSAGSPPLYVGFGSMGMSHGRNMLQIAEAALELSGLRAVISSGSHPSGPVPEGSRRMIFVEEVPHRWLFPRVAAVMHHGGAGTTAEGLRAGIPSLIFPGASDQYFWAARIARLGAGPRPVARGDLTPTGLAKLFTRATTDREMRERARLIGEKIRAENGVARAVAELLPLIGGSNPSAPAQASSAGQ